MKIKSGYILQPRLLDVGSMKNRPPIERELWLYILRNVNYRDTDLCKRGTGFFQLTQIAEDLSWYVGARKVKYKIPALSKALRRLCEGNATATTRATRGIYITVCNYDYYQDPRNYEGNDEGITKELRRQSETKESKERNKDTTSVVSAVSSKDSSIPEYKTNARAHEGDWRNDFKEYMRITNKACREILESPDTMEQQKRFNPGVDIRLTLEKAYTNFWGTEAGWKNKKKGRSKSIDMVRTMINAISQPQNKVYEKRNNQDGNNGARLLTDDYKQDILRRLGATGSDQETI